MKEMDSQSKTSLKLQAYQYLKTRWAAWSRRG